MFKPGDSVLISDGRSAVVTGSGVSLKIETTEGLFDEGDLHQAHPTVLANIRAEPPDYSKFYEACPERSSFELRDRVVAALQAAKLEVDLRGHWRRGDALYDVTDFKKRVSDISLLDSGIPESDLLAILDSLKGEPLNRWVNLGCSGRVSTTCGYCGSRRFKLETNGRTLRLSGSECTYPDGFPKNEWELNVPSGKIVVANDLRKWFPLPEGNSNFDVAGVLGGRQTAQACAAVGMSHAMVGNSCPSVFKLADGQFKIANKPHDDYWDKEKSKYLPYKPKTKFQGRRVASICTNLWWYSLCDFNEFKRRVKRFGGSLKEAAATSISVKPGVYLFRHDDEACSREGNEENVFATFEWLRDPDPVRDFLKDWQEVDVNAHAYVQAQTQQWPTLYGVVEDQGYDEEEKATPWSEMTESQRLSSWQRIACQLLCTIGGGTEWHDKGFPVASVDTQVAPIEPPSFRQQYSWYPFSVGYGGLYRVGHFAPDFAKLVFRLLESVISFGIAVHDGQRCREVKATRERMLLAVNRYRELAAQYPTLADPEYVQWLSQPERAENWVERFNLGPVYTEKHRKNKEAQHWIPEGTYAVEFDARKLKKEGHFTANGCWAHKETATGFAIEAWEDNEQEGEDNCFWAPHAANSAIPLYSVARVSKLGTVSHMGDTLIEIEFDYGTPWMRDKTARKALNERGHKAGIRLLTKTEYEALLQEQT